MRGQHLLVLALVVACLVTIGGPSARWVTTMPTVDLRTFLCAAETALAGGDPWSAEAVRALACPRQDWPYLYPAPFLGVMAGLLQLPPRAVQVAWALVNLGFGLGALRLLGRWSGTSVPLLLAIVAIYTPIYTNFRAGQVNLVILFLLATYLARGQGAALGVAAAVKLSPALLLVPALQARRWRTVTAFALAGLGMMLAGLLVVSPQHQLRFFTEVLPGFGGGFPGLDMALALSDNHSLARLANDVWPGPRSEALGPVARAVTALVGVLLVAGLLRATGGRPGRYAEAAWLVPMTLLPSFAWGNHLVFLLPPVLLVAGGIEAGRLERRWAGAGLAAIVVLGLPFDWLRYPGFYVPELDWLFRDAKVLAGLCIGACCLELHHREVGFPGAASPATSTGLHRQAPRGWGVAGKA